MTWFLNRQRLEGVGAAMQCICKFNRSSPPNFYYLLINYNESYIPLEIRSIDLLITSLYGNQIHIFLTFSSNNASTIFAHGNNPSFL